MIAADAIAVPCLVARFTVNKLRRFLTAELAAASSKLALSFAVG